MTIYELTQAISRYRRAIFISLGVLVFLMLVTMFTIEDGSLGWRGGLKYESAFEIAVVAPGTETLSAPDPTGDLSETAAEYAALLGSAEAAEVIGEMTGYVLEETVSADTELNSSIITASVIGPSPDLSKAATQNAYLWLADKIQRPLEALPVVPTTIPQVPDVNLEGQFPSTLSIQVDESLSEVASDLFVLVGAVGDQTAAVPVVERAGGSVDATMTMEAGGSLLLRLETSEGELYDTLRLAPAPLPATAPAYPDLVMTLGPGSLRESSGPADENGDSDTIWVFVPSEITTEWIEGVPDVESDDEVASRQVQVAMLTDVPTALQIGGRKAPLLGLTVFVVGLIAILTGVIVADTWRRSRDANTSSHVRLDVQRDAAAATPPPATEYTDPPDIGT